MCIRDRSYISYEDRTIVDDELVFVSEQSSQIESFNLVGELSLQGARIVDEDDTPVILEQALMADQVDTTSPIGPSIGDLKDMMFSENYGIMKKIQQQGNTDDILLETGEHMLQESPSEGVRISDISTLYPNKFVTGFLDEPARRAKLSYSAVVQTG